MTMDDLKNIQTVAEAAAKFIKGMSGVIPALEKAGDMPESALASRVYEALYAAVRHLEQNGPK